MAASSPNYGVLLQASETTTAGYKRFRSGASASTEAPQLVVTYDRPPPVPVMTAPADHARLVASRPTLTAAAVTDPDGDAVTYWFSAWTADENVNPGQPVSPRGQIIDSGWVSTPSWTPGYEYFQEGASYHWAAWARGGAGLAQTPTSSRVFTIERDLEAGMSPTQTVGPVNVNLATGSSTVAISSPGFPTVGGAMGLAYSFRSDDHPATGLTGQYFIDSNHNNVVDANEAPVASRLDPSVNYEWSDERPDPRLPSTGYLVRWTGTITAPVARTYYFGAAAADGTRVTVNGQTIVDRWPSAWSVTPVFGQGIALAAGQTVPVTIEYAENLVSPGSWIDFNFYTDQVGTIRGVPSSWLTPSQTTGGELPAGWQLNAGAGDLLYTQAIVGNDAITLTGPDASATKFDRTANGWAPHDANNVETLSVDTAGSITAHGADGTIYVFGVDGSLTSATSGGRIGSSDTTFQWSATGSGGRMFQRVDRMTDPVSGRSINLTWQLPGASCPAPEPTFDPAPSGALCKAEYWDGTSTSYGFKNGQLTRITDPGNVRTEFGYDSQGRLAQVRDPAATDALAAGTRSDGVSHPLDTLLPMMLPAGRLPFSDLNPLRELRETTQLSGMAPV